jgi:hypothetical protein
MFTAILYSLIGIILGSVFNAWFLLPVLLVIAVEVVALALTQTVLDAFMFLVVSTASLEVAFLYTVAVRRLPASVE